MDINKITNHSYFYFNVTRRELFLIIAVTNNQITNN